MKRRRFLETLTAPLLVAIVVAMLPQRALAQVVPFRAMGENAQYNPGTGQYVGGGQGTHIGRLAGQGQVQLPIVPTGNPGQFLWKTAVPHVITAADGSTISLIGGGLVQLIPLDTNIGLFSAVWQAEFEVQGGTGRFFNVGPGSGPIAVEAINQPFFLTDPLWKFSWSMKGTIDLGRQSKQ